MSGDVAEYARHFQAGGRVRIGIPLSGGGAFQEWGVVGTLEVDLLELDLSRDFLPVQASLTLGRVLDLGLLDREGGRRCRAMVVKESAGRRLVLRLIDGFVDFEPREFYRQDVYLPLDYRIPAHQDIDEITERWRQRRWNLEFAAQMPDPGEQAELGALREEIAGLLDKVKGVPPVAANISGGGVRLNIRERLTPGMLVDLSIYLPHPERVLEIVGEVVQVQPLAGQELFSTSLRYRFIDEGDRDRLIGFISAQQLFELSQLGPKGASAGEPRSAGGRRRLQLAVGLALLTAFVGCQVRSVLVARERGEKHEIEKMFEEGVSNYLRQRR